MSSNKLKVQAFRANDLSEETGKQFELGKSWCEFFEIDDSVGDISFTLEFKPLNKTHESLKDRKIELQLSGLNPRKDRKAYANGSHSGHSAIKEFFLEDLHLTMEKNLSDYFAIYKASVFDYYLYYIPEILHDNFIKFFETISPTITINRNKEKGGKKLNEPLQQIFYGAPGTGKSDTVDDVCSKYLHHRITFHPDTDYSAFVGCYKPKTYKKNMLAGNGINETQLLSSFFDSNSPKYNGKNKARYLYEALVHTKDISNLGLSSQLVADKLNAQGFTGCAYTTEANCMFNIYDWLKEDGYIVENKISYEFTPQCFIKAYVDAWKRQKDSEPVFLVIEEINRGNCAQIFGDLFQLLDRDENGFSRYEISPDTDLQEYIAEIGLNISGVTDHEGNDISALVASGDLMKLPNNLYIWATMNTSDQSLFPIDSAFKRRWEWKYIKIKKGTNKVSKEPLNWKIKVGDESYDWWEFLKAINYKIDKMTSSADKQLGYFFCLADGKDEISADTFVNKVAFYLWNDVFKDYAEDGSPLLKYKKKEDDKSESDLTFPDFFDEKGNVDSNVVKQFIEKAMKEDEMENRAE